MDFKRGSEWRKWDLHVHTASSYDAKYRGPDSDELLVKAWREHELAAVAITDHSTIDSNRILGLRKLAPEITIFPGFEMRTDKGAPNLHVVGIFSDSHDLTILKNDFDAILMRQHERKDENDDTIIRDFSVIVDFVKSHNGVLTIHAGRKTNGIDREITNALEVSQAIKKDISDAIDIFEIGRTEDVQSYREHVFKTINEKPLIMCSDNHDPRQYDIREYLWIKADPTFQGLAQTIMQPSERVFIGVKPAKLDRLQKNKSAHIQSISVKRAVNPKSNMENWFDTELELNPGLIAIIGNKGSGKSALSDIIGHICKSNNMNSASFLNNERFRKPPERKAEDYVAKIQWYDGKIENDVSLGSISRADTLEEVQYLPQKYIESVCNDLSDEFQSEIDKVIFSYVDSTERGDATNLHELIENKSRSIQTRITEIKNDIDLCNKEIIRLEDRKATSYKATIAANLKKRTEDLERHEMNKPSEVQKPEKVQTDEYVQRLKSIQERITTLEKEEIEARHKLSLVNSRIDQNNEIMDMIALVKEKVDSIEDQIKKYIQDHHLSAERFALRFMFPIDELKKDLDEALNERGDLKTLLDSTEKASEASLAIKLQIANRELDSLVSRTDSAERSYQRYLSDMKEWKIARDAIIGNQTTEGSIKFYEQELTYLETELDAEYKEKLNERIALVNRIYEQKEQISKVYRELYMPIERELIPLLRNSDDKIEFSVRISLRNKEIGQRLLSYINQQMVGVFKGKADASATMSELILSTDFNDSGSLIVFINSVLTCISEDIDKSSTKVKEKIDFYNLLTSLDYIQAEYNLTLGSRQLSMLSPGERGIVLLVFYLALSKNDIPLIIDQPEDNLDNQSVFVRLVPCIREAKKKRQVIIVTHNPNIAIACDAEQIISCSIDKADHHITYTSGSIENDAVRETVVNILEGTMPAFELRKIKYTYELYHSL